MNPALSRIMACVPENAASFTVYSGQQLESWLKEADGDEARKENRRPIPTQPARSEIGPDDLITLKTACRIAFRDQIKVATLRAEAARGHLTISRIGKRDFTTLRNIREMIERKQKCLPVQKVPASTSTRNGASGLSDTDNVSSARGALREMSKVLRKVSTNTSPNVVNLSRRRPR
jgi:hypothetical protein